MSLLGGYELTTLSGIANCYPAISHQHLYHDERLKIPLALH